MLRFVALVVLVLFSFSPSFGFETKGEDCSRCHTLKSEEAKELLKDIPNLKILEVYPSPVKGFWEVYLESGGRKGLLYVDFSKRYFISGALFSIRDKKNVTQERLNDLNRVDVSQIPVDNALVMGEKDAKYKVVVFDDHD